MAPQGGVGGGRGKTDPHTLLLEKRYELYPQAASTIMAMEEAINAPDPLRIFELYQDLRRLFHSYAAFMTKESYREFESCEQMVGPKPGHGAPPAIDFEGLKTHLRTLHLALARSLKSVEFDDLEDILNIPNDQARALDEKTARQGAERKRIEKERARDEEVQRIQEQAHDLLETDKPKKARKMLQKAIGLDPDRAVLHNDLGVVLGKMDQFDDAIRSYERALSLSHKFPEQRSDQWGAAYYNLAIAHAKAARTANDKDEIEKAITHASSAEQRFREYLQECPDGPKREAASKRLKTIITSLEALRIEKVRRESAKTEKPEDGDIVKGEGPRDYRTRARNEAWAALQEAANDSDHDSETNSETEDETEAKSEPLTE